MLTEIERATAVYDALADAYLGGHHNDRDLRIFRQGMYTACRATQGERDELAVLRAKIARVEAFADACDLWASAMASSDVSAEKLMAHRGAAEGIRAVLSGGDAGGLLTWEAP